MELSKVLGSLKEILKYLRYLKKQMEPFRSPETFKVLWETLKPGSLEDCSQIAIYPNILIGSGEQKSLFRDAPGLCWAVKIDITLITIWIISFQYTSTRVNPKSFGNKERSTKGPISYTSSKYITSSTSLTYASQATVRRKNKSLVQNRNWPVGVLQGG